MAPPLVTKSSWSTPSPLTPSPPTNLPFLYRGTEPGKNTIPLWLGPAGWKPWLQGLATSRW